MVAAPQRQLEALAKGGEPLLGLLGRRPPLAAQRLTGGAAVQVQTGARGRELHAAEQLGAAHLGAGRVVRPAGEGARVVVDAQDGSAPACESAGAPPAPQKRSTNALVMSLISPSSMIFFGLRAWTSLGSKYD